LVSINWVPKDPHLNTILRVGPWPMSGKETSKNRKPCGILA
jgi:hypothetical protein